MSIPRRGEGLCPGPPRPRWGGGPDAPRMGDAPLGEQGEETQQPLFRGGPGAIPTPRVSNDDTRDLTETPGWAIPEGQGSPGLPQRERAVSVLPGGLRAPRGRKGSGWCQADREKTVPRGCWSERYTPPPRAKPGCYWLLRDTGNPLPLASWWAGIPRLSQCQCPLLTLAPIPELRGGSLAEGSQLVGLV